MQSVECGVESVECEVWSICAILLVQVAEFLQNQISPVFLFHSIFFGGRDSQAVA